MSADDDEKAFVECIASRNFVYADDEHEEDRFIWNRALAHARAIEEPQRFNTLGLKPIPRGTGTPCGAAYHHWLVLVFCSKCSEEFDDRERIIALMYDGRLTDKCHAVERLLDYVGHNSSACDDLTNKCVCGLDELREEIEKNGRS